MRVEGHARTQNSGSRLSAAEEACAGEEGQRRTEGEVQGSRLAANLEGR